MKIFLDSCALFDAQTDQRVKTTLRSAVNRGNRLITSITVLGETLSVCLRDQDRNTLHEIIEMIGELDVSIIQSSENLRLCCLCIEEYDEENRFTPNDKTHIAYALVDQCDVFLTTDGPLRLNQCIREECPRNRLEILDYEGLRKKL